MHASLLYQTSRNAIPRHWIARDSVPLVFQCRMLETLLNNPTVLVVQANEDLHPVYGVIEFIKHKIYVFTRFHTEITPNDLLRLSGWPRTTHSIDNTPHIEPSLLQNSLPWQPLVESSAQEPEGGGGISIEEVLGGLRRQYFVNLYISKVSLAYYAKTTLAKARKECQEAYLDENKGLFEMMKFIETTMLRTPEELEMKFKKWLPLLIKVALDETNGVDMNGWPEEVKCWSVDADEQEFILKWCNCDDDCVFQNKKDANKRIDALKFRELF